MHGEWERRKGWGGLKVWQGLRCHGRCNMLRGIGRGEAGWGQARRHAGQRQAQRMLLHLLLLDLRELLVEGC